MVQPDVHYKKTQFQIHQCMYNLTGLDVALVALDEVSKELV